MVSRTISALKVFSAGCFVYFVMAACTASQDASSGGNVGASGTGADAAPGATSPVSNAMADDFYTSGSRLKVQTLEGSDGSKQFFGWFDSTRKEQCNFAQAFDQTYRCLPRMATMSAYFSDAGCSVRLASYPVGSPATVINQTSRYAQLGPAYHGTLWNGTNGQCFTSVGPSDAAFFSVGDEVPATTFADATLKTAP